MREKTEKLERFVPGLGETALHYFYNTIYRLFHVFTPEIAMEEAKNCYWEGEEDETSVLEQYGEDASDTSIPRRKDFEKAIPLWATYPKKKLSRRQLESLAGAEGERFSEEVHKVAQTLLRIERYPKKTGFRFSIDGFYPEGILPPAVIFRWDAEDHVIQVLDDTYQPYMESGGLLEVFGVSLHSDVDPKVFRKWIREVERGIRLLMDIDALVDCISDPARAEDAVDAEVRRTARREDEGSLPGLENRCLPRRGRAAL